MTNWEKWRSQMSIEEFWRLAKSEDPYYGGGVLTCFCFCKGKCPAYDYCEKHGGNCKETFIAWAEEEVRE